MLESLGNHIPMAREGASKDGRRVMMLSMFYTVVAISRGVL